jgi:hypothetical protein
MLWLSKNFIKWLFIWLFMMRWTTLMIARFDSILLDFSKAFDKIPHERLAAKLHHYGVCGNTLSWIKGFLANSKQRPAGNIRWSQMPCWNRVEWHQSDFWNLVLQQGLVWSKSAGFRTIFFFWNHVESHNILSDKQHGFRKKRSCESQLILTIQDLAAGLNSKSQIDAILLDLSAGGINVR